MPTAVDLSGFEHGVQPTIAGTGLFNNIVGGPTLVTSPVHSGAYALFIDAVAEAESVQTPTMGDGATEVVGRIYLRCPSLPGANKNLVVTQSLSASYHWYFQVNSSGQIRAVHAAGTAVLSSNTVAAGEWFRIDWRVTGWGGATHTLEWQLDGVAQTNVVQTGRAATTYLGRLRIGSPASDTFSFYADDYLVSTTSADYPIGAGQGASLVPSADGTHVNQLTHFTPGVGAVWSLVEEVPLGGGADNVAQTLADGASYVEVAFADTTSDMGTINGVRGIAAGKNSGAGGNNQITRIRYPTTPTDTDIHGTDWGSTSIVYKSVIVPAPSGSWSTTDVGSLVGRFGFSTDVAPNPQLEGIALEIDYVPANAATVLAVVATATAAAQVPVLSAGSTVTAVAATATAQALAPVVSGTASVSAVPATATAAANPPTLTYDYEIGPSPPATATALAVPPTVSVGVLVTSVTATATATAIPPVVTGETGAQDATVSAVVATATASALAPSVSASATVPGVVATATAAAGTPAIGGGAGVVAVPATATAGANAPTLSVGSVVVAVPATATAQAHAPSAGGTGEAGRVRARDRAATVRLSDSSARVRLEDEPPLVVSDYAMTVRVRDRAARVALSDRAS